MSENEPRPELGDRSIRTLAWIGDAEFERELRLRLARRGDYPTDRLDKARARIASAIGQAELMRVIQDRLDEAESALARRARNASINPRARVSRDVKSYRAATALEALVAHWSLDGERGRARFEAVLVPALERALEAALEAALASRRG